MAEESGAHAAAHGPAPPRGERPADRRSPSPLPPESSPLARPGGLSLQHGPSTRRRPRRPPPASPALDAPGTPEPPPPSWTAPRALQRRPRGSRARSRPASARTAPPATSVGSPRSGCPTAGRTGAPSRPRQHGHWQARGCLKTPEPRRPQGRRSPVELVDHGRLSVAPHHHLLLLQLLCDLCDAPPGGRGSSSDVEPKAGQTRVSPDAGAPQHPHSTVKPPPGR